MIAGRKRIGHTPESEATGPAPGARLEKQPAASRP